MKYSTLVLIIVGLLLIYIYAKHRGEGFDPEYTEPWESSRCIQRCMQAGELGPWFGGINFPGQDRASMPEARFNVPACIRSCNASFTGVPEDDIDDVNTPDDEFGAILDAPPQAWWQF